MFSEAANRFEKTEPSAQKNDEDEFDERLKNDNEDTKSLLLSLGN